MTDKIEVLNKIIRERRAIYAKSYIPGKEISREWIETILENGNWAPTHKRTEPWRFIVHHSPESRQALADYLGEYFIKNTPEEQFSVEKFEKVKQNPLRAGCVIVIVMHGDPVAKLPEWEEIAAVSCAVQNMWLTASALGLGAYWSTPSSIIKAQDYLQLQEGERCLGMLYLGHTEMPTIPGQRGPLAQKTTWK